MPAHLIVDALAPGDTSALVTGAEAHHAASVLRLRVGEPVSVTDGRGATGTGSVASVERGSVRIGLDAVTIEPEASPALVLVQALAKGDRDELALQAATELGVDAVVPWAAARSVARWTGERRERGAERWRSIARSAAKQSHRSRIPEVRELASTRDLERLSGSGRMLVLEPTARTALVDVPLAPGEPGPVVIVVGPEGGIAPDELEALSSAGASAVRLTSTVLRTSTAGPAAIAVISARLGRWDAP